MEKGGTGMKSFRMTDALALPMGPHMDILGCRQVRAEGVTGLLAVEDGRVRMRMGAQVAEVTGEKLVIMRMDHDGLVLEGVIRQITLSSFA